MTLKDLKAAYLTSPHFRDVYLHLLQNRASLNKSAAHRLELNAHNYMILDGLLFKITENDVGEMDTGVVYPHIKSTCVTQNVPLKCDGWTCRYNKMLPNNQPEVLFPKFGRATKSIYNWMPCVPAVQER